MFFYALGAALYQDFVFFCGFIVITLLLGSVLFWFVGKTCCKDAGNAYYSEFSRIFFWLFGFFLLAGLFGVGFNYMTAARTIPFKLIKSSSNSQNIQAAVQYDYDEKIKRAKTSKEKEEINQQYEDDGFVPPKTANGKLVIKDNSKIPYHLIDAAEIRHNMERSSGNHIKIPYSKNPQKLPLLSQKKNKTAIAILNFMVGFRFWIWFGIWCLLSLIPLCMGFSILKRGSKEHIEQELSVKEN